MGTRSLTHINNGSGRPIVTIYRQFDGYYEGHGAELVEFLSGFRLVNGLGARDKNVKIANGMHCLAAQIVAHLKDEPGNIYLYEPGTKDVGEEYVYHVQYMSYGLVVRGSCVYPSVPPKFWVMTNEGVWEEINELL